MALDMDEGLERLRQGKYLLEEELKQLCERVGKKGERMAELIFNILIYLPSHFLDERGRKQNSFRLIHWLAHSF